MRWSVSQSDEAAEAAARRHREIARIIDRAEQTPTPTPLFGTAPANPPSVVIHAITLVRQICKRGEYWYDQNGNFHAGPHYERTEVSGQLDAGQIQAIGEEVIGYATAYRRGKN